MSGVLDTDAILAAVGSCPAVSSIATPSRTDPGPPAISHDHRSVAISVIAFYGRAIPTVTDQIEQAVRPLIGDRELVVTVEDLDTDPAGL